MSEREFIDKCETAVIEAETKYMDGLIKTYQEEQVRPCPDDFLLDKILGKILKEQNRTNPKDKYDEEEVAIARIVRRR